MGRRHSRLSAAVAYLETLDESSRVLSRHMIQAKKGRSSNPRASSSSRDQGGLWSLRISIDESHPPIWRRVIVSTGMTLHQLHAVMQSIFSWQDYHLYQFTVRGETYAAPDEESEDLDATKVKLSSLGLAPSTHFSYLYDFGDDWAATVVIEGEPAEGPEAIPWLLDGSRAGPLEDSGGISRYNQLVSAWDSVQRDVDIEPGDEEMLEWAGPDFDPNSFGLRPLASL
jgi:hypothetical protein